MCNLVEMFPDNHENYCEFKKSLRSAFLYAKTVTLGRTHWEETNQVMSRNRRIGTSLSGIAQFVTHRGLEELRRWCESGYTLIRELDEEFSDKFGVSRSNKVTSIKPSGTISLLAGATAGMHYPISRFYKRRVRTSKSNPMAERLKKAGFYVEDDVVSPSQVVITFPVDSGSGVRPQEEVSMWEQLKLAAFLQKHWSDNQVSCTVTFDPKTEGPQIPEALKFFEHELKSISFIPHIGDGGTAVYAQMPYEKIDKVEYENLLSQLDMKEVETLLDGLKGGEPEQEKGCDADNCLI